MFFGWWTSCLLFQNNLAQRMAVNCELFVVDKKATPKDENKSYFSQAQGNIYSKLVLQLLLELQSA